MGTFMIVTLYLLGFISSFYLIVILSRKAYQLYFIYYKKKYYQEYRTRVQNKEVLLTLLDDEVGKNLDHIIYAAYMKFGKAHDTISVYRKFKRFIFDDIKELYEEHKVRVHNKYHNGSLEETKYLLIIDNK